MNIQFSLDKTAFFPETNLPKSDFVPALLRRKLSVLEKAALCALNAVCPETPCPVVFASRFGEWRQTFRLFRQFWEEKEISPAGFSLSVHNAAPGIHSLVKGDTSSYTAISAGNQTLESGLLEAILMRRPILFVYAEEPVPEFYEAEFSASPETGAIALLLGNGNEITMSAGNPDAEPLTVAALKAFSENRLPALVTKQFALTRKSAP